MSFSTLPSGVNHAIKPFTLNTPAAEIEELKTLIKHSRIAVPTFENSQKDGKYGIDREWMQNIKEKWLKFDWSKTEDRLNSFPHFKASITDDDGTKYDIHFAALFSQKADAVPLVMLHGWPGSFLEFIPILQLLKDKHTPETLPYHVIVPSLPGYTLSSGPPTSKDSGYWDIARIVHRLMSMLGFGDGYVAQGGDLGSAVARVMGAMYPGCKAVHVNLLIVAKAPPNTSEDDLTDSEKQGIARGMEIFNLGLAYALEHATRPSTIGLVLASNPMALMAWIGEKFLQWSDVNPSDETIIEFITLYWLTNTMERCIYPYRQDLPNGVGTLISALSSSNDAHRFQATPSDPPPSQAQAQAQAQDATPQTSTPEPEPNAKSKPLGFSA
ncbi:hypothetical protein EPUS_08033 [Endocarpon pusillum Z07020]|uniref:Epoxide hydrolase N-terminal domain-containing protein n=1 Tax=Endocarpon pusillum (strain Z07020 / HMAS-L-300199) TaxID=1263415 RepID=U1FY43_ENDPU|nr:uncharacterized protein EPUS_08033 [Endocarpon pusillum Z07020]ERF69832.1 hypothetical protein EPUS_08033 [Endocarpon pusillum Z07020]